MKNMYSVLALFATVLFIMSIAGMAATNNTTSNVSGTPTVTGSPTQTFTSQSTVTGGPTATITSQPTPTEPAKVTKTIPAEPTKAVEPTETPVPTATPKSPGFGIVGAIIVLSAIYLIGKRR